MNNVDEVAQTIADRLKRPDDIPLLERLTNTAYALRALLMRRDFQRKRELPAAVVLSLGCQELKKVDISECCDVDADCKVKRTVDRIPAPLRRDSIEPFVFVGSPFGTKYNYYTELERELVGVRRFESSAPGYIYKNGYIYVFNTNAKEIVVKDAFEDPRLAATFDKCKESKCSIEEDSFTPEDMISIIEDELARKEGVPYANRKDSNDQTVV